MLGVGVVAAVAQAQPVPVTHLDPTPPSSQSPSFFMWPIGSTTTDVLLGVTTGDGHGFVVKVNPSSSGYVGVASGVQTFPIPMPAGKGLFGQYRNSATAIDTMWTTDGTLAGTARLAPQVTVNENGSVAFLGATVLAWVPSGSTETLTAFSGTTATPLSTNAHNLASSLVAWHGAVYFVHTAAGGGGQLWKTDGTPAGTQFVLSLPYSVFDVLGSATDGVLVFGDDGNGPAMFVPTGATGAPVKVSGLPTTAYFRVLSAGTSTLIEAFDSTAGMQRVFLLPSGSSTASAVGGPTFAAKLVQNAGPRAVLMELSIPNGNQGRALWSHDGTTLTKLVNLVATSTPSSGYTTGPGVLLLGEAPDAGTGNEPWYTDGTPAGTTFLGDLTPGPASSGLFAVPAPGGGAVFVDNDRVYFTSGTAAGTTLLTTIPMRLTDASLFSPLALGPKLLCTADDQVQGRRWFTSDGTAQGTAWLADAGTVANQGAIAGSAVIYPKWSTPTGLELWMTDGVSAGPLFFADGGTPITSLASSATASAAGRAYFVTTAGDLYRSDGTANAVTLVPGSTGTVGYLYPVGDQLFASSRTRGQLWAVTSPDAGLTSLVDFGPGSPPMYVGSSQRTANLLYFFHGTDVWRSDGTVPGTRRVANAFENGSSTGFAWFHGALRDEAIIRRRTLDGDGGYALAVTDETDAGIHTFLDLAPFLLSSLSAVIPTEFVSAGEFAIGGVDDGVHGLEPWVTDGTPSGTHLLKDLAPGPLHGLDPRPEFFVFGNTVYLAGDDGVHGPELWRTDGTAAGTVMVGDGVPGIRGSDPTVLTNVGCDGLYLSAIDDTEHRDLWVLPNLPGKTAAPVVTPMLSGPLADAGWFSGPVTVHFAVSSQTPLTSRCKDVVVSTETAGQTVGCTATTACGVSSSGSVVVRLDHTPPGLACPPVLTLEATSPDGGALSLAGIDAGDPLSPVSLSSQPPAGFVLPLGQHGVVVSAADEAGNVATCLVTAAVVDSTPPVLTCPANMSVPAADARGASATFTATATDAVDVSPSVIATPASGSTFPIGATSVLVKALDRTGNSSSCSFLVTVTVPPPTVTCPANITRRANGSGGASVTFDASAQDGLGAVLTAVATPASGSVFPVGATDVAVHATDASGTEASCHFTVTVTEQLSRYAMGCDATGGTLEGALALVATAVLRRRRR